MGVKVENRPVLFTEPSQGEGGGGAQLTGVPQNARWHSFVTRFVNTAGTIQHRITSAADPAALSTVAPFLNNMSTTLQNTPTGANASTAMVGGLKIDGVNDHVVHFDTEAIVAASLGMQPTLFQTNNGTTHPSIFPQTSNIDINGVTQVRFSIQLHVAETGAGFGINTTNLQAGEFVDVLFQGFMESPAA